MRFFDWLIHWINDPFGRKQLLTKHEHILLDMVETTTTARVTRQRIERSFPIARTVGNPRLRRDVRYDVTH